jgi:predicted amidohydrolase
MKNTHGIRVACLQLAPRIGDTEYNRTLSAARIRDAAAQGAQVIVLPELMQSGYLFSDLREALDHAESLSGPTVTLWAQLARALEVVVVAGFCERLNDHQVANSAVLIQPEGLISLYRKAHLWDAEKLIFTPGNQPPPVVQTRFGRIGMLICYDLEFPEWVRLPALAGAELLCAPVNWPDAPRPAGERPAEVVRVQANAAVNRMFIATCDRYARERSVDWVGGSVIVDPDGYPVAGGSSLQAEQVLWADLDLAKARDKSISPHNHVHRDRRPSLY